MCRDLWIVAAICVAVMPQSLLADGRLDRALGEVHEKSDDDLKPSKRTSFDNDVDDDGCDDSDEDSLLNSLLNDGGGAWVILAGVTSPWWGPRSLLNDDGFEASFGDFPYADDWPGFVVNELPPPAWTKSWAGRISVEYGSDFGGLKKYGGRLQLETASRFGIDTEWNRRTEEVFDGHDSLWIGDFNLVYRFAQSPRATFYTGLGVNWLSDRHGGAAGFNFTYGADFFPARPWVLSGSMDWGRLGDASLLHGRATIGVLLNRVEVFTGYDHLDLEGVSLPSWIAGLQLWF